MLDVQASKKFRKDMKRMSKRGKDKLKLGKVLDLLAQGEELPTKYDDHALTGNWTGHRECHIAPDWLLIYRIDKDRNLLYLTRTGTHSDLF